MLCLDPTSPKIISITFRPTRRLSSTCYESPKRRRVNHRSPRILLRLHCRRDDGLHVRRASQDSQDCKQSRCQSPHIVQEIVVGCEKGLQLGRLAPLVPRPGFEEMRIHTHVDPDVKKAITCHYSLGRKQSASLANGKEEDCDEASGGTSFRITSASGLEIV